MHFVLSTGQAEPGASFGNGGPESGPEAVLQAFLPLCTGIAEAAGGSVTVVSGPNEAKAAALAAGRGQASVHLCFALPDQCFAVPSCPTIPVFGWGLSSIPAAPGLDWRGKLAEHGRAICLSSSAAAAVGAVMGANFPVCAIVPPPRSPAAGTPSPAAAGQAALGSYPLLDTATWSDHRPPVVAFNADDDLADAVAATPGEEVLFRAPPPWRKTLRYRLGTTRLHARNWYRDAVQDLMPGPVTRAGALAARGLARAGHLALQRGTRQPRPHPALPPPGGGTPAEPWPPQSLVLSGTVFAAVHGMWDRSWSDAISAFVWAFRDEPGATLLLRSAGIDAGTREALAGYLRRLLPFRCRVVLMDAALPPAEADALTDACTYYVCASHAEAAPLPMIGFLARGRPAVTPAHSALADVADASCAFIVASSLAHDYWTNDPRERLLTHSHRLDWDSLCAAYRQAFAVAQTPAYADMQRHAARHMAERRQQGAQALTAFLGLAASGARA